MALALLQAAGQVANQAADVEIDAVNKPGRPLVRGIVRRDSAVAYAALVTYIGLLLVGFDPYYQLVALMAWGYSYGVRAKARFPLDLAWQALSRGLLAPIAVSSFSTGVLRPDALVLGVHNMLWVLAFQATKDVWDVEGDRRAGVETLATLLGPEGSIYYMVVAGVAVYFYSLLAAPWLLFVDFIGPAVPGLVYQRYTRLENNAGWFAFYMGLGMSTVVHVLYLLSA